jgi:hypothetical protein
VTNTPGTQWLEISWGRLNVPCTCTHRYQANPIFIAQWRKESPWVDIEDTVRWRWGHGIDGRQEGLPLLGRLRRGQIGGEFFLVFFRVELTPVCCTEESMWNPSFLEAQLLRKDIPYKVRGGGFWEFCFPGFWRVAPGLTQSSLEPPANHCLSGVWFLHPRRGGLRPHYPPDRLAGI